MSNLYDTDAVTWADRRRRCCVASLRANASAIRSIGKSN